MKTLNILGHYSIQHIVDELFKPMIMNGENFVFPPKYMYIRKLIPVVLDLHKVQYSCWSTLFRDAARAYNLLHHIDPTIPPPVVPDMETATSMEDDDSTILLWCQQDAVLLTWIYVTVSPYLLVRLGSQQSSTTTSAMDAWECLRDICREHDIIMQKKKRRFIHIDLNESYNDQGGGDDHNDDQADLVSNLPDHLLIYILSLAADMKTAGRTSILSKRWTRLWTDLMDLDFNLPETCATLRHTCFAQPEMDKFVDWVNQVIVANRAPYLRTFRVHFVLSRSYAAHLDKWLKFAFDKDVRNLDLSFGDTSPSVHFFNIFSSNNPALILNTTLESLHLNCVSIKGPLLQWVITNCLNLQRLSLHRCMASPDKAASSKHHRKLVISSLKLKHLEFFRCLKALNINALHLSAPNLTSFICNEFKINVEYHSVPSLVDVTLGESYFHHLDALYGFSSQLKKLSIWWDKPYYASCGFPTFTNVQQLEILCSQQEACLLPMTSLTEACPLMHTFKLKLMFCGHLAGSKSLGPNNTQSKATRFHQHLKVVEYLGYAGCAGAAELALYLTWHAPMLRRFIFDTRQPQVIGKPLYSTNKDQMDKVRRTTELLAHRIRRRKKGLAVVIL